MQYINVGSAIAAGKPYRRPMHTNLPYCINIILAYFLNFFIILWPLPIIVDYLYVIFYLLFSFGMVKVNMTFEHTASQL